MCCECVESPPAHLLTERHQFVLKQVSGELPNEDLTAPLWWGPLPARRGPSKPPLAVLLCGGNTNVSVGRGNSDARPRHKLSLIARLPTK